MRTILLTSLILWVCLSPALAQTVPQDSVKVKAVQCTAISKSTGKQCLRHTRNANKLCFQHQQKEGGKK